MLHLFWKFWKWLVLHLFLSGVSIFLPFNVFMASYTGFPRVEPVGAVSYMDINGDRLKRDVLFCYDLKLPEDFVPSNNGKPMQWKFICSYFWIVVFLIVIGSLKVKRSVLFMSINLFLPSRIILYRDRWWSGELQVDPGSTCSECDQENPILQVKLYPCYHWLPFPTRVYILSIWYANLLDSAI